MPTEEMPKWRWGFSDSGWSNNQLAIEWIRDWFIPQTGGHGKHRLLVLDGHESHESLEFSRIAIEAGVHLFSIPPHTSDKLQPLNVGAFSGLKAKYEREL